MNKSTSESVIKVFLGTLGPAGILIDELLFEYGARMKQERINSFVEELIAHTDYTKLLKLEGSHKEDFHDILHATLLKVSRNKSKQKISYYRNIILNNIEYTPKNIDLTNIYLDIIDSISDIELLILDSYCRYSEKHQQLIKERKDFNIKIQYTSERLKKHEISPSKHKSQIEELWGKQKLIERELNIYPKFQESEFYNISEGQFIYLKQRLVNKGIFSDSNADFAGAYEFITITEFGKGFYSFLITST